MAWTKAKLAIVGAVVIGIAVYSVVQHQAQIKLREQNEVLRKQMAQLQADNERLAAKSQEETPRLPAPQIQTSSAAVAAPAEDMPSTNLFERFKDKTPQLTPAQVEAYLNANGRKASTLLAAYRTGNNAALLREAMASFPNDPAVAFEAATSPQLTADEKRPWLKAFEQSAPDNALANYLSAIDDFKSGQSDAAIRELAGVSGKQMDDYTQSRTQDDAEAFLSAGYTTAEAQTAATQSLLLSQLLPLKQLGQQLVDLANAYNQSGDTASAQAALGMAMNLGHTLQGASSSSPVLISQLVGMAVQRMALNAMDPNSPYGADSQTVQDQLNQIAQTKATINALDTQTQALMPNLTDQDWINFMNRRMLFGEVAAMQWVVNKYGQSQ